MEQSPEIKNLVLRYYEAISRRDSCFIERLMSHQDGLLVIGTDPEEWWTGYENVIAIFKEQMEEMGSGFSIVPGDLQAFVEGTVGWVADRAKLCLSNGIEIPIRLTAILHRENGGWKLVQRHFSIGVRNEEMLEKVLTV
jgi:ketosteroid isomerase-like protein